ncbi:MAG: serine protease [Gammaproteobacteria bacterium]|nr:serine protease [Gammaproteobacteria bacterium]
MKKSSLTLLGLAIGGLMAQAMASDFITVESYQPPLKEVAVTKAAQLDLPRLPVSQSVVLERLQQDRSSLQKRAFAAHQDEPSVPLEVGFDRAISSIASAEQLHSLLQWQQSSSGGYSAALRLVSPEASGSRVIVLVERLHAAAVIRFISDQSGEEVSITGEEIINTLSQNQDLDRHYVGPYLDGGSVVVEIHLPAGINPEDTRLAMPALSHIYMDFQEQLQQSKAADLSCMVSTTCYSEYDNDSSAVAAIRFNQGGKTYACSGTLLNDTGNTGAANFITANHCVSTQAAASTLESRWFYKTSSCGGSFLDSRDTVVRGGAEMLFTQAGTDTTLLRLKGNLPSNVLFKGWSTVPVIAGLPASILHHPDYSSQKLTMATINSFAKCSPFDSEGRSQCEWLANSMGTGNYIRVTNTRGAVIGGSSGSGLLVTGTGGQRYYVGTLSGGSSSCSRPSDPDLYGRFDQAYNSGLSNWLNVSKPPAAVDGNRGAIYRLYHTGKGTHFFTASAAERDSVVNKYPAYVYEGAAFYTYPKAGANLSPVYRFYNSATGAHFYTISQAEKDSIQSKRPNFIYEGVAWYASTKTAAGTQPLYRFFNEKTGTHFYTTSAAEKDNIINRFPSFIYEGIAYHVWPQR